MRKRVTASFLLATIVVLGLPSTTLAASPSNFHKGSITLAGAKSWYARLENAAKKGCDHRPLIIHGSMSHYKKSRACYSEKLTAAVERIDSDTLTEIHNSK